MVLGSGGRTRPRWRGRVAYAFDTAMAHGPVAMVGWLALLSGLVVLTAALVLLVTGLGPGEVERLGFAEATWQALLRALDPGTMGGDEGWGFRLIALAVTIGGILFLSTLIGVITSGIEQRVRELRRGRSVVLESGHTLVLGWSPSIGRIVSELVAANANQRRPRIVVVADRDKTEMEEHLAEMVPDPGRAKFICRSGLPTDPGHLDMGNPREARSILILSPPAEDCDAHVVKTLLALVNTPHRRPGPYSIVAEMRNPAHIEVAAMVGGDDVRLIARDAVLAHITAQTSRQSGLSAVYTDLLNFRGDEFYFAPAQQLVGRTFGEALLAFDTSALVGLRRVDGGVTLAPPMETRLTDGDELVLISRDDDTVEVRDVAALNDPAEHSSAVRAPARAEHSVVLNWNARAAMLLRDLEGSVAADSTVTVVDATAEAAAQVEALRPEFRNQTLHFHRGDPTDRGTLEAVLSGGPDHVIILSSGWLAPAQADTSALLTLLHTRDIVTRSGRHSSVVTEMLDRRNRDLARVTSIDDFIVSEEMISLLLAQIAETPHRSAVFADLFEPGGATIAMPPAADYVRIGEPVRFASVVASARRYGEVVIGYRRHADADRPDGGYGVVVNPRKANGVTFSADDRVVVLVPEEGTPTRARAWAGNGHLGA